MTELSQVVPCTMAHISVCILLLFQSLCDPWASWSFLISRGGHDISRIHPPFILIPSHQYLCRWPRASSASYQKLVLESSQVVFTNSFSSGASSADQQTSMKIHAFSWIEADEVSCCQSAAKLTCLREEHGSEPARHASHLEVPLHLPLGTLVHKPIPSFLH